jgi:hypothetical protein
MNRSSCCGEPASRARWRARPGGQHHEQPDPDLSEFGERRLELALDRKLVPALVQTTPSGSQMAERQRREFVAAELHLDVDELVDGVPDVGYGSW